MQKTSVTISSKVMKKTYSQKGTQKGFANNKAFSNTIKLFLTKIGFLTSDSILLTPENEAKK